MPDAQKNTYKEVKFNCQYRYWNVSTHTQVCALEVGHYIGFRHTDSMNRSCD